MRALIVSIVGLALCPQLHAQSRIDIKGRIQIESLQYRGPSGEEWLTAGMRDAITNDLSRIRRVEVITVEDQNRALQSLAEQRKAGLSFADPEAEVARILKADYRCVGVLVNDGNSLKLDLKLLQAPDYQTIHAASVAGSKDDVFGFQDRIVETLLKKIEIEPTDEERVRKEKLAMQNPRAFELYSRGVANFQTDPLAALNLFESALKLEPNYIDVLNFAGRLAQKLGDSGRATSYFERRKAFLESKNFTDSQEYATTLNNIGTVFLEQKEYGKARDLFQNARIIRDALRLTGTQDYATNLNNIALAESGLTQFDQAMQTFAQAQQVRERNNLVFTNEYCVTLNNMGTSLAEQNKHDDALPYFARAQEIRNRLNLQKTLEYAMTDYNIGSIHLARGRTAMALIALTGAERTLGALGLTTQTQYALVLTALGEAHFQSGDFQAARTAQLKARTILAEGRYNRSVDYASLLASMAETNLALNDLAAVHADGRNALQILDSLKQGLTQAAYKALRSMADAHIAAKEPCKALPLLQDLYRRYKEGGAADLMEQLSGRILGLQIQCN